MNTSQTRTLCLLLILLCCIFALTGCQCSHEWTDADCLTAKTCAKCGEAEGEPLGHNYTPATCTTPETCTRCGETQGQPLDHVYGEWDLGEDAMTRTCEGCGQVESAEADRELYLRQKIAGMWDIDLLVHDGVKISPYELQDQPRYLSFAEDGSVEIFVSKELFHGTLTFVSYTESDSAPYYSAIVNTDNSSLPIVFFEDPNGDDALFITYSNTFYEVYSRNEALAKALTGSWACAENGLFQSMTLNADHTFTADWDGEVSGTWHLRPILLQYSVRRCSLIFSYTKDGVPTFTTATLNLGNENTSLEEHLSSGNIDINIYNRSISGNMFFKRMSSAEVNSLRSAMEDGPQNILGTWQSSHIYTHTYSDSISSERDITGYSITFSEDGTFTAQLDQHRTGTWKFDRASGGTYTYYLHFNGIADKVLAYYTTGSQFSIYTSSSTGYKQLFFTGEPNPETHAAETVPEDEAVQFSQLPLGDWTSAVLISYDNFHEPKNTTDYRLTFSQDGTFTAKLDQEYTGIWELTKTDSTSDEYTSTTLYYYSLTFDGITNPIQITIGDTVEYGLTLPPELNLEGEVDGIQKLLTFYHMTPEELTAFHQNFQLLQGTWTATGQSASGNTKGYTITFNPDFTFTAEINSSITGTWYQKFSSGDPQFKHYSEKSSCPMYIRDGILNIGFSINDELVQVEMKKQ